MWMKVEATYTAVTPVFCVGADETSAEVRLPSFKGVLRFWWRALAWSKYGGDLNTIAKQEDHIFGSTSTGQSRLLMRLASVEQPKVLGIKEQLVTDRGVVVGEGCRYLGYGLMSTKNKTKVGQLNKPCVVAPYHFTVSFLCRDLDDESVELVCDALKALGTFGGIGARTRRGYGSLALSDLWVENESVWQAASSMDRLKENIAYLLRKYSSPALPEYTALSRFSRCMVLQAKTATPLESLNTIGREMIRYRSYGRKESYPERIAFDLPQNYYFSSDKFSPDRDKSKSARVAPAMKSLDRRASPLFIHIHSLDSANTRCAIVLTFLPARFLPPARPSRKAAVMVDGFRVDLQTEDELYEPIHRFFKRLLDSNPHTGRKEPILVAEEIRI
ncbi:MAG TPA: type III-B CRISPR module RAMP protein Cmr1 [Bacillota bacterium]|jgi:CRISPR-associated protein Cmr1|nr:type III-B CRISPR module RAMP protein Cmr1 [Bacillota bacterium]HQD19096.1 type III-B CRISPR module RAMP protein Cmr1 [Bacillota bacterium]